MRYNTSLTSVSPYSHITRGGTQVAIIPKSSFRVARSLYYKCVDSNGRLLTVNSKNLKKNKVH